MLVREMGPAAVTPLGKGDTGKATDTISVAQMNLWNLFDTEDNPDTGDMVKTPEEYAHKLHKIANGIKELGLPDLISVNEVENEGVLADLAAQDALRAAGYKAIMRPSNDGRGINVGFMYRADKLDPVNVEQVNADISFPDGGRGQLDTKKLYARPPLAIDFRVRGVEQAQDGSDLLTVVTNHFKSKLGGQIPEQRRQMQGQYLGEWLDARAKVRPTGATIVLGDLNANPGEGAYEKLAKRADGSDRFFDVTTKIPAKDRYTYIYRGNKDLLDHMLLTPGRENAIEGVKILHVNSGNDNRKMANDPKKLNGFSDHDPILATFNLKKLLGPVSAAQSGAAQLLTAA